MSPDTPVTIVMTTYFKPGQLGGERAKVAADTLNSWINNIEGIHLNVHIADDGSDPDHWEYFWDHIRPYFGRPYTSSRQNRRGVGASLNTGFLSAFEESPLVLYAVDDWSLFNPTNLAPWCQLLIERTDVGLVRLGPPHPGICGTVEMFTESWQGWGLRLDRHHFAFGHRPALYHKRFIDHYGLFAENVNALECERLYNERFCQMSGPDIVLALPHPWRHIDTVSLSALEP